MSCVAVLHILPAYEGSNQTTKEKTDLGFYVNVHTTST